MEEFKGLFASRTVWGGILALLAGLAGLFGYTVTAEDTATLTELLASVGSAVGGIVAIYGRIVASKRIG